VDSTRSGQRSSNVQEHQCRNEYHHGERCRQVSYRESESHARILRDIRAILFGGCAMWRGVCAGTNMAWGSSILGWSEHVRVLPRTAVAGSG